MMEKKIYEIGFEDYDDPIWIETSNKVSIKNVSNTVGFYMKEIETPTFMYSEEDIDIVIK